MKYIERIPNYQLWWFALMGVWPLADPDHFVWTSQLSVIDLALHVAATAILLRRWVHYEANKRMKALLNLPPGKYTITITPTEDEAAEKYGMCVACGEIRYPRHNCNSY